MPSKEPRQPKPAKKARHVTIQFAYDQVSLYSWTIKGGTKPRYVVGDDEWRAYGAGGFNSIPELLRDVSLLETFVNHLGAASVPKRVIERAKYHEEKSKLPLSEEQIDALKALYPDVPFSIER
jgi:hypothetical protein